jgi:hypothetical protein
VFCKAGEDAWAEFFIIVESEDYIGSPWAFKDFV